MYSPCETCKLRFDREYNHDCDFSCEYAALSLSLKELKVGMERLMDLSDKEIKRGVGEILDLFDNYPLNLVWQEIKKNVDDSE